MKPVHTYAIYTPLPRRSFFYALFLDHFLFPSLFFYPFPVVFFFLGFEFGPACHHIYDTDTCPCRGERCSTLGCHRY